MGMSDYWHDEVERVQQDFIEGKIGEEKYYDRMESLGFDKDTIDGWWLVVQEDRAAFVHDNSQFGAGA